jgi:hypothetical protein
VLALGQRAHQRAPAAGRERRVDRLPDQRVPEQRYPFGGLPAGSPGTGLVGHRRLLSPIRSVAGSLAGDLRRPQQVNFGLIGTGASSRRRLTRAANRHGGPRVSLDLPPDVHEQVTRFAFEHNRVKVMHLGQALVELMLENDELQQRVLDRLPVLRRKADQLT